MDSMRSKTLPARSLDHRWPYLFLHVESTIIIYIIYIVYIYLYIIYTFIYCITYSSNLVFSEQPVHNIWWSDLQVNWVVSCRPRHYIYIHYITFYISTQQGSHNKSMTVHEALGDDEQNIIRQRSVTGLNESEFQVGHRLDIRVWKPPLLKSCKLREDGG